MKPHQAQNLLERTTELLSSNEKSNHLQSKYLSNSKLSNQYEYRDNNNELSSQLEGSSSSRVEELDYYKDMIYKMNSDIGDINAKLQSIDCSLTSSLLSGNLESMRSVHCPIREKASDAHQTILIADDSFNTAQSLRKKEIKSTPKKESTQTDSNDKGKRLLELEMNSKALLDKNKELEKQLRILENIINEPIYTKSTPNITTEEITLTEPNHNKAPLTTEGDNNSDNDKHNHTISAKTINTAFDHPPENNSTPINAGKQKGKKLHADKATASLHKPKKRSKSVRTNKVKSLPEADGVLKAKMTKLTIPTQSNQPQIAFNLGKDQYFENERRQYIEKMKSLESAFNQQVKALSQKYQSTIEKQESKIKKLTQENEELKQKLNQIKTIMK